MENQIKSIKVYTVDGLYHSAEVTKEGTDGVTLVEGFDNVVNILSQFSLQERALLEKLIADNKVVLEEKEIKKAPITAVSEEEPTEVKIDDYEKRKKRNGIIALVVAGVLALTGTHYVLSRNKKYTRNESNVRYEEVINTPTPVSTSTPVSAFVQSGSTITKVETGIEIPDNGSKYVENLNTDYVERDDLCQNVYNFVHGIDRTKENIQRIINDMSNKSYSNINELCGFVTGFKMTGDKFPLSLQNMYDIGDPNYFVLQNICQNRNTIIEDAYLKDSESVREEIYNYLEKLTDFVFRNKPMYNGNRYIYFHQLNIFSKLAISDIFLFMLLPDVNYAPQISGSEYSKDKLMEDLQAFIIMCTQEIEKDVSRTKTY